MSKQQVKVFISYAHDDEPYYKVFSKTLKTQLKSRNKYEYVVWDDNQIHIGSLWDDEIKQKIADSNLAILCISDSFLASDYIKAKEFGVLIKSFQETMLAPFLLSPCNFNDWDELASRQLFKPKGDWYQARNEDFTFADLVQFSNDNTPKLNPNIGRYIRDFIAKIEESLTARPPKTIKKISVIDKSAPNYITDNYPYFEKDNFFGREELLTQIDNKIKTLDVPLLLSGIGGMGKSAVAVAYGKDKKYCTTYDHIAWVDVTENVFSNFFSTFHKNDTIPFEFSPDGDRVKDIAKIMQLLKQVPGENLLLIDNVNDEKDLTQFINTWTNYELGWKCLVTTRCENNEYKKHLIKLEVISLESGEKLFTRHNDESFDKDSFKAIYEYIGGHTLLIELLAKFGQESSIINSTKELLAYLKEKGINALNRKVLARQGQQQKTDKLVSEFVMGLYDPFILTEEEQEYLRYFSVLPASDIEFKTLISLFNIEESDQDNFDILINSLVRKGWLMLHANNFKCHQVIQEICKKKLSPDAENCVVLINRLGYLFENINTTQTISFFEIGLSAVSNIKGANNNFALLQFNLADRLQETGNLLESLKLLKTAKDIYSKSNNKIEEARCIERIGYIYAASGNLTDALSCYSQCNIITKELVKNSPDVAKYKKVLAVSYQNLGDIYFDKRDIDQALNCYLQYNAIGKELVENNPSSAEYKNVLAISYRILGNSYFEKKAIDQALNCYLQDNTIEKNLVENNPGIAEYKDGLAQSFQNLGDLYFNKKDIDQALNCFLQCNAIEKELVNDNPGIIEYKNSLAVSYHNLGDLYFDKNDIDQALNCYLQHNTIEKELVDSNPSIVKYKYVLAVSYHNLGDLYFDRNDIDQALSCYLQCNAIGKELVDNSPEVSEFNNNLIVSYSSLAKVYQAQENLKQAFDCYLRCITMRKELIQNNPDVVEYKDRLAISYSELGSIYQDQEKLDQALNCYLEEMKIIKELANNNPYDVEYKDSLATSYSELGSVYQAQENLDQALNCYLEEMKIITELANNNPHDVEYKDSLATSYSELGSVYQDQENLDQALNCYLEEMKIIKELANNNPDNVEYKDRLATSYSELGSIYQDQENLDQALNCYLEEMKIIKELANNNPDNVEYKNNLAMSYANVASTSSDEDAKKYHIRAKEIWELLNEKMPQDDDYRNNLEWLKNEFKS